MEEETTLEQELAAAIERTTRVSGDEVIITSALNGTLGSDRTSRRPDISAMEDAFSPEGIPLFEVGGRIVIERYAVTIPGLPWLDTQTYVVQDVDPHSGVMKLWNPHLHQAALSNFKMGLESGFKFKLAPVRGGIGKRKRGRPAKNPPKSPAPAPTPGEKRGRGRPKGSKNHAKGGSPAPRS